jgi:DeoR/GlpR family transcriptional regulator of sugar metabolism
VTLAALRRAEILVEVRKARSVNVTELSRRFGVSSMTVRRDLEARSRTGELTRVHGGAMAGEPSSGPFGT